MPFAPPPLFTVDDWAWVYNFAATIRQGAKKDTDVAVPKTKLSIGWIVAFKILAVGPTAATDPLDNRPLDNKLAFLTPPPCPDRTPTIASLSFAASLAGALMKPTKSSSTVPTERFLQIRPQLLRDRITSLPRHHR